MKPSVTNTFLRIFLGIIFIYASLDKIANPEAFAVAIRNYQILPESLVNLAALILPWLELVIGALMLANRWVPGALLWINILMIVFAGSLIFNILRGINVYCGCFSTRIQDADKASMTVSVVRDLLFLGASLFLFIRVYKHNASSSPDDTAS